MVKWTRIEFRIDLFSVDRKSIAKIGMVNGYRGKEKFSTMKLIL